MRLNLALLVEMHPLLPPARAADIAQCAAVGLRRHGHAPGAEMVTRLDEADHVATLGWMTAPGGTDLQLDHKRVTEDAAEAIALALVNVAFGWVIRRRLQQGESADWLLEGPSKRLIGLEVSGVDAGDSEPRLRAKLLQAERLTIDCQHVACVVELASPRAVAAGCSGTR